MRQNFRTLGLIALSLITSSPTLSNTLDRGLSCFTQRDCASGTLTDADRKDMENKCVALRAATCSEIKDESKLYSCDFQTFCSHSSLDTAIAGTKGCAIGAWDATGGAISKIIDAIKDTAECSTNLERKLDLIDQFNETLPPGQSFKAPPVNALQRMTCGQLKSHLRTKAEDVYRKLNE